MTLQEGLRDYQRCCVRLSWDFAPTLVITPRCDVFQDESERQRNRLLAGLLRCDLPGGPPWGRGLSSPLCLLLAHRGALHVPVPERRSRQHPTQCGAHQFRVRGGPCLVPFSRRHCPQSTCDFGRSTTIVILK